MSLSSVTGQDTGRFPGLNRVRVDAYLAQDFTVVFATPRGWQQSPGIFAIEAPGAFG